MLIKKNIYEINVNKDFFISIIMTFEFELYQLI